MSSATTSAATLTAEYVNPVITSVKAVFETMLGCTPARTGLALKETVDTKYEVSAVIGLSGRAAGTIVLTLAKSTALGVLDRLVGIQHTELTNDVCDAVGELSNMIAGGAKARLERLSLSISVPSIITGHDHQVRFPSNVHPICIGFDSEIGPFAIEVGVAPVE